MMCKDVASPAVHEVAHNENLSCEPSLGETLIEFVTMYGHFDNVDVMLSVCSLH